MKKYYVELTGNQPLLMHADSVEFADKVKAWLQHPENKKSSIAGDDRSPAWRWIGSLYADGKLVTIPSDNLMTMLREGGAMVTLEGKKTFKSLTQSGLLVNEIGWPLRVASNAVVEMSAINPLRGVEDFDEHVEVAKSLGFELFVKRAKIGTSKHVRVRPRFDVWSAAGTVTVFDKKITSAVLEQILTYAGQYKGLCDWRPSSKTPGSFGTFTATIKEV